MSTETQSAGWRGGLALGALVLALLTVAWFAAAALGTKYGLWSWQFGLGTMTVGWGPRVAMAAVAISAIALIAALIKAPRKRATMLALAALLVSGFTLGRLAAFGAQAGALPPIHDIQTDWSDPIEFSTVLMQARAADGEANPVLPAPTVPEAADGRWPGTGGRLVSELQEEAEFKPDEMEDPEEAPYPFFIETLVVETDLATAARAALELAEARDWEIVTPPDLGGTAATQLEATATTGWFGFRDDIAVRLRQTGPQVVEIDIRSVSRVGLSDLGLNARRVHAYMSDLARELR